MGVAERREREREERRSSIVDAAERVFFDTGAIASTMDDVASEAELSKGTLYLYFNSKDDLFLAIAYRGMSRMVAQLEAVPGDNLSGHQHFAGILASSREFGRDNPDHMRTLLAWMASGFRASQGEPFVAYQQLVARLFKLIVGVVERGKTDGSIRPELDAHQVMMSMWGGTMGMWLLYFSREEIARRTPTPVDFDVLLPVFQTMLLRAIRAEGAGGDEDI